MYQEFLLEVNHQLSSELAKFFTISTYMNKDLATSLRVGFNRIFKFMTEIWVEPAYYQQIFKSSRIAINVLQITDTMAKNSLMF